MSKRLGDSYRACSLSNGFRCIFDLEEMSVGGKDGQRLIVAGHYVNVSAGTKQPKRVPLSFLYQVDASASETNVI